MQTRVRHFVWDVERFGLTPMKIWARLTNRIEPTILSISIPKAGTHLLERALCLHPRLYRRLVPTLTPNNEQELGGLESLLKTLHPGQILVSHLHYSKERWEIIQRSEVRAIFIIRDPRDIVVSSAFYISKKKDHPLHRYLYDVKNVEEKLRLLIKGNQAMRQAVGYLPLEEELRRFKGWLDTGYMIVRFEDLVNEETRVKTIAGLYEYLGTQIDKLTLAHIAHNLASPSSPTFRSGVYGQWMQYFTEELKTLFDQTMGCALEWYGYEREEPGGSD